MITYSEVASFHKENKSTYEHILKLLEEKLIEGRDERNVPVYLTKYRVKKVDDIYLKLKRKNAKKFNDITDYAGLRIICLFTEDLFDVHQYFLDILVDNKLTLSEVCFYNFDDYNSHVLNACAYSKKKFPEIEPYIQRKESGYKSIHYLIVFPLNGLRTIEIQLRTLFQDVWGELEHNLSYKKGSIHPYIKKSFQLLANNINNNDDLISHLYAIQKREMVTELYENNKLSSRKIFKYEKDKLPEFFFNSEKIKAAYEKYTSFVENINLREQDDSWVEEARSLYDNVLSIMSGKEYDAAKYWISMEEIFFQYCVGDFPKALNSYLDLFSKFKTSYIIPFRIGEILILTTNTFNEKIKALTFFDKAEKIINSDMAMVDLKNTYLVYSMLALVYWSLGNEFFNVAIEKINKANESVEADRSILSEIENCMLINNLCYYHLENYIYLKGMDAEKANESYDIARDNFFKLKPALSKEFCNSNMLDTCSWFCYHAALRGDKSEQFMVLAKDYCRRAIQLKKLAQVTFRSFSTHVNHLQTIMSEPECHENSGC